MSRVPVVSRWSLATAALLAAASSASPIALAQPSAPPTPSSSSERAAPAAAVSPTQCAAAQPGPGDACPRDLPSFVPRATEPPPPSLLRARLRPADPALPPPPSVTAADTRLLRGRASAGASPQARALLLGQIAQLEGLLRDTPRSSSDRPTLLRKTADAYIDLEGEALAARSAALPRQAAEAESARKLAEAANAGAVRALTTLIQEFDQDASSGSAPDASRAAKMDEALYFLAYEHEQAQRLDEARPVYFRLIKDHPRSTYVAYAYLAFGELFFEDGRDDPGRLELARLCYERVLSNAPVDNRAWGYAQYKLGHVFWLMGGQHLVEAEASFGRAIAFATGNPTEPGAAKLAEGARRDVVRVHALRAPADAAFSALKPLSGDRPGDDTATLSLLRALCAAYLDAGRPDEALVLIDDLTRRAGADCRLEALGLEAQAARAGRPGPELAAKLEALARRARPSKEAGLSPSRDESLRCGNAAAEALLRSAVAAHRAAQGSARLDKAAQADAARVAAGLYRALLAAFGQEQLAAFSFPRVPREDWPTPGAIQYALGDLLRGQDDWAGCGRAYGEVSRGSPSSPEAPLAIEAETLCYLKLHEQRYPTADEGGRDGGDEQAARALTADEAAMVGAFERFLCAARPDPEAPWARGRRAQVAFARAGVQYEARRWQEAAAGFRQVALDHPDPDLALPAALLYLDAARRAPGPPQDSPKAACVDEMVEASERLLARHCETQPRPACAPLERARFGVLKLRADVARREAERAPADGAPAKHEQAARMYFDVARRCALEPIGARRPVLCQRPEQLLFSAAESYQSGRFMMKSIRARLILLDPRFHMERSDEARRSVFQVGKSYKAISVYDEAASWFEKYAQDFPRSDLAPVALSEAVTLRLSLGQDPEAARGAELYERTYGAARGAEAARVAFAVASQHAQHEEWAKVRQRLRSSLRLIDRSASIDVQVQAHALLGRASDRLGQRAQAAAAYGRAIALWSGPRAQVTAVGPSGSLEARDSLAADPEAGQQRLERALMALGEALVYAADSKRTAAEAIRFPAYTGPADEAAIGRHLSERVAEWATRRRHAIDEAERAYGRVLELRPSPPPRWVIAAAERVASLHGAMLDEALAARLPASVERSPSLRAAYRDRLEALLSPTRGKARAAYETCLAQSATFQHTDERVRACEAWLARNGPRGFSPLDELRPRARPLHAPAPDRPSPAPLADEAVVDP